MEAKFGSAVQLPSNEENNREGVKREGKLLEKDSWVIKKLC